MTITFTSGSRKGERISFGLKNAILMGRSRSAQIRLRELDVAGRHAEIMPSDGGVQIICHSRHGLRVNGNIVSMDERRSLSVGDEIAIGRQVRFTVDDISDTVDETVITFTAEPKESSGNKYNESRINSVDGNEEMSRLLDNVPQLDDLMAEDGPEKVSLSLNSLLSKYPDNIYAKMLYGAYSLLLGREEDFRRVFDEINTSVMWDDALTGDDAKTIDVKEMEAWRRYSQAYEKMYAIPAER